ncbi:hypothetical protein ACJJTC_004463 [Scirpophaga incertulas]
MLGQQSETSREIASGVIVTAVSSLTGNKPNTSVSLVKLVDSQDKLSEISQNIPFMANLLPDASLSNIMSQISVPNSEANTIQPKLPNILESTTTLLPNSVTSNKNPDATKESSSSLLSIDKKFVGPSEISQIIPSVANFLPNASLSNITSQTSVPNSEANTIQPNLPNNLESTTTLLPNSVTYNKNPEATKDVATSSGNLIPNLPQPIVIPDNISNISNFSNTLLSPGIPNLSPPQVPNISEIVSSTSLLPLVSQRLPQTVLNTNSIKPNILNSEGELNLLEPNITNPISNTNSIKSTISNILALPPIPHDIPLLNTNSDLAETICNLERPVLTSWCSKNLETFLKIEEAAAQHSYRTYHQVQQWLRVEKDPTEWGWTRSQEGLKGLNQRTSAANSAQTPVMQVPERVWSRMMFLPESRAEMLCSLYNLSGEDLSQCSCLRD